MNNMRMENITLKSAITLDKQELAEIYERYSPGIFRYACRMLADNELAEDCVSETFSRFLTSVRSGKQPDMVQAYLYRAAHNWIIDHFRHNPIPNSSLDDDLHADPESNPAQQASKNMDHQRVQAALLRLPVDQRQVIELRFMEEWSHTEVAEVLGKTIEATRVLQHRAVNTLRKILAE